MTTRKLPLILLLMIVIVSTVSFLPVQEAKASTELAYDDGSAELGQNIGAAPFFDGVKFVLADFGLSGSQKVVKVSFYVSGVQQNRDVKIHVTTDLLSDLLVLQLTHPAVVGWWTVDLSSYNVIVTGDFYVVWEVFIAPTAGPGVDTTSPHHSRSYDGTSLGTWILETERDFMMRAEVDPYSAGEPTFDLTTSSMCACSTTAVYTIHIENPTPNTIAISGTIPAGYTINSAYMTSTAGLTIATGSSGTINPHSTLHTWAVKTTTTPGTFEIFVDSISQGTGTLTPPTQTTPGSWGTILGVLDAGHWTEGSLVPGFFTNPCTNGTYTFAPNTATALRLTYTMQPRPGYSNQVRIQACGTVGGVSVPTSKLEILAPFAALAGLIAAVSAVVVVKRRRD